MLRAGSRGCDFSQSPGGSDMAVKRKADPVKFDELGVSSKEQLRYFRDMLLIRRFEERAGQMYGMGLIGGFCHLYIGQEAVVVGMQAALKEGDTIVTSYRDHGHMLAAGMDPKGVMAELTGRRSCVTYLGDGAINQGQVYESFNMAALWKLPMVYAVENNRYGMGTSIDRASARTDLFHRGMAYGIPGEQVDGMNVLAVYEAGLAAAEHARSGQGPIILEMMTYRYRGHSMSDPAKYRTRDEVNRMRTEHDPIEHLRHRLLEDGTSDAQLKEIEGRVRDVVTEAAQFAQDSPEPDPAELWTDVFAEA